MSGTALLAALAGAAVLGGALLVVMGLLNTPATSGPGRRAPHRRLRALLPSAGDAAARRTRQRAAAGSLLGSLLWLLTGWVVAVVVVPLAAVGLPVLLRRADTDVGVRRLEALEEWTRHLAGVLDVGVGLEQAITVNLRSTPEAIRPQVQALVARLASRWPTEPALRAFADDLDDATGDLVAASLVLGAQRRGAGLTRVLDGLADTVADEVRMRRQVEADRAKPRTTARAVTLITLVVLALLSLNTAYIAPYGTPLGQMVLLLLIGAYAAALVWMQAMTRGRPVPRFLGTGSTAGRRRVHGSPAAAEVG